LSNSMTVKFVRWPAEAERRHYWKRRGVPCLLVVEAGAQPPISTDTNEDWIRAPISRTDLEVRVRALRQRNSNLHLPVLDPTGTLSFESRSVILSTTQTELMEPLVKQFGEVVYREELQERLSSRATRPTRNSLDLHILRLRRRLGSIGLIIRTAWGRGYLLDRVAAKDTA
jgi:DNA-binding response OmpR family regulator